MRILPILFPRYTWSKPKRDKVIYLTFDDGPIPDITEWVLDVLQEQHIKATFFCIGDNIRKHPSIFKRILAEGHQIGNHTFNHIKGWNSTLEDYLANVDLCQREIQKHRQEPTCLFRPPYGKIKKNQGKQILAQGFAIMMWTLLTRDYEESLRPEACLKRTLKRLKPGSIIVFHDSLKAERNMKYTLPLLIAYAKEEGYSFARL